MAPDCDATEPRTPEPRGLYSLRDEVRLAGAELADWGRRLPGRVQPDPRRWTAVGWANAIYIAAFSLLSVLSPLGDDGKSTTWSVGLLLLMLGRGSFVWWWARRPGADVQGSAESSP